jgi:hypothetical protein
MRVSQESLNLPLLRGQNMVSVKSAESSIRSANEEDGYSRDHFVSKILRNHIREHCSRIDGTRRRPDEDRGEKFCDVFLQKPFSMAV